jgi:Domain of unknown function (DUF4932)
MNKFTKMTNKTIITFLLVLLTSNSFSQKEVLKTNKEILVAINPNLETFAIVERFANQYSKYLKNRDEQLKNQECTRPMVHYAYQMFKNLDNVKIAKHMAQVIDTIIGSKVGGQDQIFYALSYAKNFPAKGNEVQYKFYNSSLTEETNHYIDSQISILIEELREYYIKNRVDLFLEKYKSFYDGAMEEVKNGISKDLLFSLEKYYRKKTNNKYSIFIVPTRAFTKGEWQANACKIPLKNNMVNNIQFLSSSYIDVDISSDGIYKKFGFGDKEWLQDMIVHEFGHTFCEFNEDIKLKLKKTNLLFSGKWEKYMQPLGYYTWVDCVNEHIVRTGEIRIAEMTKNTEIANRLRKSYISTKKFILIPLFEEKFKEYEKNKIAYKSFQDFLPEVIKILDTISLKSRDYLLSETEFKGEKTIYGYIQTENEIIFQFELPLKYDPKETKSVTIAGTFNNWNPRLEDYKLNYKSNQKYELVIPKSKFVKNKIYEFKFVVNEAYWQNVPEFAKNIDDNGNLTFLID